MAKLRVLLPFNGIIWVTPFFGHILPILGLKLVIFLRFFLFWALFSLRGESKKIFATIFFNSFYIPKWSQKSYLEKLYFSVEFLYLYLENPKNRFLSLFYLKLKNAQNTLYVWSGKMLFFPEVIKNLSFLDDLDLYEPI